MNDVVILGAGGFLGRALVDVLSRDCAPLRVLTRRPPAVDTPGTTTLVGDARDPATLLTAVTRGSTVVNLVPSTSTPGLDGRAMTAIARACLAADAGRVVHCSTATVVGRTRATRVDEKTPCRPTTPYEQAKLSEEDELRDILRGRIPTCVARPTVVFGPEGRNLLSLAHALCSGPALSHRLRSLLFGSRKMHLIPVRNAAAALAFLVRRRGGAAEETFLVSDDDAPGNDFENVERALREGLGAQPPSGPHLPPFVLGLALRLWGRSDTNPSRFYDPSRLLAAGFVRPTTVAAGLAEFATWFAEASQR